MPVSNCGGTNQPACPPTNAVVIEGVPYYTLQQMQAYGVECYEKGVKDAKK